MAQGGAAAMSDKATPGKDYPGVECRGCGNPIAFLRLIPEDGNGGAEPLDPQNLPVMIRVKCPKCGREASYQRSEIRSLLARRKQ